MRMLAKRPGFTVAVVLTLALGIGANTAIFSAAQAIFLRDLPYKGAERLIWLTGAFPGSSPGDDNFSLPDFADLQAQNQVFDKVAAYHDFDAVVLAGAGEPVRLTANFITASYFDLFDAKSAMGRTFSPEENRAPDAQPVVVLSHGCWQRVFGSDPEIVGRKLQFNQVPVTVIGVMKPEFRDLEETSRPEIDVWLPMGMYLQLLPGRDVFADRNGRLFWGVARLKDGVSLAQARTDLRAIAVRLEEMYPATNKGFGLNIWPLKDHFVGDFYSPVLLLLAGSGFVLLIGCANVANLLLARVVGRRKEMAVRSALGATRFRLIRQLLVECSLLSLIAGGLGLLMAMWAVSLMSSWGALRLPAFVNIQIDGQVLAMSILLSLATGLIFGLVPAIESAKVDIRDVLNQSSKQSGGLGHGKTRRLLIVAEVSLSLMLLIGAGLMLKSFQKLASTGLNFPTDHLLTLRMNLSSNRYNQPESRVQFARSLIEKVESTPGVQSAIVWGPSDVGRSTWVLYAAPEGRPVTGPADFQMVHRHSTNPGGLAGLGIPLLRGRDFDWQDTAQTPMVAIISESLAKNLWPDEDAMGKRFQPQGLNGLITVIGIAADARLRPRFTSNQGAQAFDPQLDVYLPYSQRPNRALVVAMRTTMDSASAATAMMQAAKSLDPDLPVYDIRTLDERLSEEEGSSRAVATLMAVYAALALFLAALGIYSVLAHSVTERTREIGIRMALGASSRDILKLVIGQGMRLVLIGVASGLAGAMALTRVMSSLLFGVSATDSTTFAGIAALLISVALLACYIPARRATKVDPGVALRYE